MSEGLGYGQAAYIDPVDGWVEGTDLEIFKQVMDGNKWPDASPLLQGLVTGWRNEARRAEAARSNAISKPQYRSTSSAPVELLALARN